MREWKMQEWKVQEQTAGMENAGRIKMCCRDLTAMRTRDDAGMADDCIRRRSC